MKTRVLQVVSFSILVSLFFVSGVFSAPPGSQYTPGQTNSPTCSPGDTNCDVDLSSIDNQTLSLSGSILTIVDGNMVNLSSISGTSTFSGATDTNLTGTSTGSTVYYNGSQWVDLGIGTANQFLTVNSAGTSLEWKTSNTVATEDIRVLLGSGASLFNGSTVTISQTWGSLAANYESIEFEITNGTSAHFRSISSASTENWVDDSMVQVYSDIGVNEYSVRDMDITGNTLDVYEAGIAFDVSSIKVYGVKAQKTVISNNDIALDATGITNGQVLVWNSSNSRLEPGSSSTFSGATDTNLAGTATGSTVYYNGTQWIDLDLGTAGQQLVVNSSADGLEWISASSGSLVNIDIPEWGGLFAPSSSSFTGDGKYIFNVSMNAQTIGSSTANIGVKLVNTTDSIDVISSTRYLSVDSGSPYSVRTSTSFEATLESGKTYILTQITPPNPLTPAEPATLNSFHKYKAFVTQQGIGGTGGATTLTALTDTNITSPGTGSTLHFDGSDWIDSIKGVMYVGLSANTILGINEDIPFNNELYSQGTSITRSGDEYTLLAGNVYEISADILTDGFSNPTNGQYSWDIVNASDNGVIANAQRGINRPPTFTFSAQSGTSGGAYLILSPATDITIKIRSIFGTGTATVVIGHSWLTIKEL